MDTSGVGVRTSGRSPLVVRALAASVAAIVLLIALLSVVSRLDVQQEAQKTAAESLAAAQHVIDDLEAVRQRERRAQTARAADSPLLRIAVAEAPAAGGTLGDGRDHLQRRLIELAAVLHADAVLLKDPDERTVASAGPLAASWPLGGQERLGIDGIPGAVGGHDGLARSANQLYRTESIDLAIDGSVAGRLYVATLLDDRYARELAGATGADVLILDDAHVVAATVAGAVRRVLHGRLRGSRHITGVSDMNGESFAFRRLRDLGHLRVYAVTSVDAIARPLAGIAFRTLALTAIALCALITVALFWLTKTIVEPARRLTHALEERAWSRDVSGELPRSGSPELDGLIDSFQELLIGRRVVEAETQAACTAAIRAIAGALDRRDPHWVGHSERVSALAVAIGKTFSLDDDHLEILRLGALLHDIGNIGVPDAILGKPGPLSDAEYDRVRMHPALGARILRSVPFLAPHVPIVELHHERPDGRGYPYGLRTDATPLDARIVRVADAYDAMTSTRAYRDALSAHQALEELWRCAGTSFDETVVEALVMALRPSAELSVKPDVAPRFSMRQSG